MTEAREVFNAGHSGYTTSGVRKNLNTNPVQSGNSGGFWLRPGNGKNPGYVTLNVGGNDHASNGSESVPVGPPADSTQGSRVRVRARQDWFRASGAL